MTATVVVLNRDLMLGVAISNTVKRLGFTFQRVQSIDALRDRILGEPQSIALVIIDMNMTIDWPDVQDLIAETPNCPPILGFGPHIDVDGRRAAKRAGLTRIVSNGEFHKGMAELIERYARGNSTS